MKRQIIRAINTNVGSIRLGLAGIWRDENDNIVNVKQRLLSGKYLDLLSPSIDDFTIEDLANGLSREARWNGQTKGDFAFSVAQHSVLVMEIVNRKYKRVGKTMKLAALIHDAEEGLGAKDIITPLKVILGDVYSEIGSILQELVFTRFELEWPLKKRTKAKIKNADLIAAAAEAKYLVGFSEDEIRSHLRNHKEIIEFEEYQDLLSPWPAKTAKERFIGELEKIQMMD